MLIQFSWGNLGNVNVSRAGDPEMGKRAWRNANEEMPTRNEEIGLVEYGGVAFGEFGDMWGYYGLSLNFIYIVVVS